jgi:hypothetical protein
LVVGLSKSCATLLLTFRGLRTGAIGMAMRAVDRAGQIAPCFGGPGGWRSRGSCFARAQAAPGVPGLTTPDLQSAQRGRARAVEADSRRAQNRRGVSSRRGAGQQPRRSGPSTASVQIFPRRSRIIRMTTISPMPPVGPYPQLLLCPHVGNTPTKARIRMIRRIVPILICHL